LNDMTTASRPPLRAPAALALAIYALILVAGPALQHGFACSGHGAPHCLVCASVQSVSSAAEPPTALAHDGSDAGMVLIAGRPREGVSLTTTAGDRAPPAA
jgi:hypothetical protein